MDRDFHLATKVHFRPFVPRRTAPLPLGSPWRESGLGRLEHRPQSHRYEFKFAIGMCIAVAPPMDSMKFLKNRPSKRNIQFITLAKITYVDALLMFRATIPLFCAKLLPNSRSNWSAGSLPLTRKSIVLE